MEFLPISSTAHSIILANILNIKDINIDAILAISQIGIMFSLLFYFKNEIFDIFCNIFKKQYITYCIKLMITMLPTIFVGLCCYSILKQFHSNFYIAIGLIFGSLFMLFAEKYYQNNEHDDNDLKKMSFKNSIIIGLCQCLSMFAGVSRSAMTISGGLLSNFSREKAIKMSFFISIPISFAGAIFDIYKNIYIFDNMSIVFYTLILSFVLSLIFIKKILNFLKTNKLNIFIYYRILLAFILIFI